MAPWYWARASVPRMLEFAERAPSSSDAVSLPFAATVLQFDRLGEKVMELGFLEKTITGIIEELIKRHKQIDAVHFIQAFRAIPPSPLLKTYIEEFKDTIENNGDATVNCLFSFFYQQTK
ncbi:hypothetical protein Zm00014a_043220 [Zea mays]|uniref:FRIGIDA-like protein n=1 Tax=Zea mays TaxID=4577 RepID=A0A3L6FP54_MAIZE|nr:hypothetical protein Zm00014a_043220 [Zea mays]